MSAVGYLYEPQKAKPNWPCLAPALVHDTLGERGMAVRTHWVMTGPLQARTSMTDWIQDVSRAKLFKNMQHHADRTLNSAELQLTTSNLDTVMDKQVTPAS